MWKYMKETVTQWVMSVWKHSWIDNVHIVHLYTINFESFYCI
jgi:hypothetical protein